MRIWIWIALNLIDLITAIVAMERGLAEANPIISWLGSSISILVVFKVILTLAVIFLLIRLKKEHLFKWLNIGMTAVVIWNLVCLLI
jgi:hypothetical protein